MGFLSHRVDTHEIIAGDHIYTWTAAFAYSHHGIYVGQNKVIHFRQQDTTNFKAYSTPYFSSFKPPITQTSTSFSKPSSQTSSSSFKPSNQTSSSSKPRNQFSSSFSSSKPSNQTSCPPDCGFKINGSGVVLTCLNCFLGKQSLYCFQYGVTRLTFLAKLRGGTCTTAKSDPPNDVIHRAAHLLRHGFGNYDVLKNNCEDFALYCKTGLLSDANSPCGGSGQVTSAVNGSKSFILSASSKLLISNPFIGVATAVGYYNWSKYANDIGVRGDVVKVPVENVKMEMMKMNQKRDAFNLIRGKDADNVLTVIQCSWKITTFCSNSVDLCYGLDGKYELIMSKANIIEHIGCS